MAIQAFLVRYFMTCNSELVVKKKVIIILHQEIFRNFVKYLIAADEFRALRIG